MGTYIKILLIVLFMCGPAFAQDQPTLEQRQQRVEKLMKELEFQMKTPNTENRVWTGEYWQFRCVLGNASISPIWVQIWDGEKIIWSQIISSRDDKTVWLGDKRARVYYMLQWKPIGGPRNDWVFKGFRLDSKAAFIANGIHEPILLVEEEDVQRYNKEARHP